MTSSGASAPGPVVPALALASLSTFVAMLAYSGPLGNAPTIDTALAASAGAGVWILSAMSAGLAVSLLTVGVVADQLGRRRVFELGAAVLAGGSVVCALAGGPGLFIVGRFVAGLGAAGVIATGLGLVTALDDGVRTRSLASGWWGAAMGVGIALGPLSTGLLDLVGWWRVAYWALAVAGAAIAVAARRCVPETAVVAGKRVDSVGGASLALGVGLVLVALIAVRQGNLEHALLYGCAAVLVLGVCVLSQFKGAAPMVDMALFRRADFLAATLAAAVTGIGVIALMSYACTFLVTGMHTSSFQASALLALWSGTSAASALASRRLVTRVTGTTQLALGLTGTGIGLLLLAGPTHTSPTGLIPGLTWAGIATGVLNAGLGRQATATVPADRAAAGVGMNNTARYIGASAGVTLVAILASAPHDDFPAQLAGWNHAAVLAGLVTLLGAIAVLAVHHLPLPRREGERRRIGPHFRTL